MRYVYAEKERKALVLSHSRDDVNVNIDMAKQCRGRKGSQRKQVNNNPLCSHEDKYPSVGCISFPAPIIQFVSECNTLSFVFYTLCWTARDGRSSMIREYFTIPTSLYFYLSISLPFYPGSSFPLFLKMLPLQDFG